MDIDRVMFTVVATDPFTCLKMSWEQTHNRPGYLSEKGTGSQLTTDPATCPTDCNWEQTHDNKQYSIYIRGG